MVMALGSGHPVIIKRVVDGVLRRGLGCYAELQRNLAAIHALAG